MNLFIVLGFMATVFLSLLGYMIYLATKQGELNKELEDNEIEIEDQKGYAKIASRPSSSPDVILKRMRQESENK